MAPSGALYTFSIGANDLFGILQAGLSLPASEVLAAGAAQIVANEAGILQSEGAKDLVLFDVPDLGVTPEITMKGPLASMAASELSAYFDRQVLSDLAPVEAAGLTVFDLDTYALIDEAVNDPSQFNFSNVTDPCTGTPACYTLLEAQQNKYLFWDDVHPTAAGHLLVADDALRARGLPVPEPSTWAMMILGLAGLGALGAQRPGGGGRLTRAFTSRRREDGPRPSRQLA